MVMIGDEVIDPAIEPAGIVELEAQAIAASGHTADFRSGVTAFARKQTPTFSGR